MIERPFSLWLPQAPRLLAKVLTALAISSTLASAAKPAPAEKIPVAVAVTSWSTNQGDTYEGTFAGVDKSNNVILHLKDDTLCNVPFANLSTESRAQTRACNASESLSVLILGDSMSLDGFGKRLDQKLRDDPHIGQVHTYMACGTHPLSWLKSKPYSTIKTYCGFWSIESVPGTARPREVNESANYGSKRVGRFVPKLETLLDTVKPDVVIMQSGNNFFSFFNDGKTIQEELHAKQIKFYVSPFMNYLATKSTSVRKLYWVTPPQAGKVTDEIQAFVHDQIQTQTRSLATLIDSRTITHFPYKMMSSDKEHFEGQDAYDWADSVFDLVTKDLHQKPIATIPKLTERAIAMGGWDPPVAPESPAAVIKVKAKLLSKTPVPAPDKFAPYREYLVGCLYEVAEVIEGKYEKDKLLVMHPAYIRLVKQPLEKLKVGKTYTLQVRELDKSSLWNTIRRDDASDSFDLAPCLLAGDEMRHPDADTNRTAHRLTSAEHAVP